MKNVFASMCLSVLLLGCNGQGDKDVTFATNPEDYTSFLQADPIKSYAAALEEKEFWSKRLGSDSTGVGDLGPLAGAYSKLFETSGAIQHLKDAEQVYKKAITVAAIKIQDGYKRALAKNYNDLHTCRSKLFNQTALRTLSERSIDKKVNDNISFRSSRCSKSIEHSPSRRPGRDNDEAS